MLMEQGWLSKVHKHEENIFADVSTSWWWGAVAPTFAAIWNPDGQTFFILPSVVLTPPWTNRYFMKIGGIYILGTDRQAFDAGGTLKGANYVFAQFQYNFTAYPWQGM
jgi:hypothetical protein